MTQFLLLAALLSPGSAAPAAPPVRAAIDTTLTSAAGHIRQLAFDGDPDSYFASEQNPGPRDHFTLVFDRPVALRAVSVTTGRPDGRDRLDAGTLEASADGERFEPLVRFAGSVALWPAAGPKVRALRIRPAAGLGHPLVLREFAVTSEPPVAIFTYPVEFEVDVRDAPEMKAWAEKVARVCERWYPLINEELKSEGFKPPRQVRLTLRRDYAGVAECRGNRILGSVRFFQKHPDDVGAMVHETVHVVQQYRGRPPSWLVEGIADYIRFFKYEPGKLGPLNAASARYDGSYRTSAAFLAYVAGRYDGQLVIKLNRALREGAYREELFRELTGKTVQELDQEWRASLRRPAGERIH